MIGLKEISSVKLVEGVISHQRFVSPQHSFKYNCISVLINLNKIKKIQKINFLFSINRFNIFSWNFKEHGNGEDFPLDWARREVSKYGGDASGTILLHCFPKIFGYAFNPLSVYFCFNKNNILSALIYEVRNTVGGIHSYVSVVNKPDEIHSTSKLFEVSPFLPSNGHYKLRASIKKNNINISVNYFIKNKNILFANQIGKIKDLTLGSLFNGIINGTASPAKPMIGILYEAFKLLFKGAKYKKILVIKEHKTSPAKKV
tara:strand:- start:245 stop:1021 length:777 start_codon:yes stop_codon:yes gene_type:complete